MDKLTDEKTASFVDMLAEIGHESPIEHASFTFGIEGVSRSLLAQITRHRIASFSVQSQRYVAENRFDYVLPPEIEALPRPRPSIARRWRRTRLIMRSSPACSRININKSCSPPAWRKGQPTGGGKSAPLRMRVLSCPTPGTTKMIVTMNARSLQNFFRHRCCNRAQWEIRELAERMRALCVEAAPHLFRHAGPPCLSGSCPEGKMSCGKMREVREKYGVAKER